jgi:hypothetical protein
LDSERFALTKEGLKANYFGKNRFPLERVMLMAGNLELAKPFYSIIKPKDIRLNGLWT